MCEYYVMFQFLKLFSLTEKYQTIKFKSKTKINLEFVPTSGESGAVKYNLVSIKNINLSFHEDTWSFSV